VRLFVALEISPAVRENLSALMRELRALAPAARWVRTENLHVTLKFIGETPQEKLDAIQEALSAVRRGGPIAMDFRGLGFFPDERRPRVFWVGLAANGQLERLAGAIETQTEPLGFPRERRAFSPHLTLARLEASGAMHGLRAVTRERGAQSFGELTATEFCLFQSKLKPSGAQHTRLASFPLAEAGS
jgi:2'-5' RNA ligase